VSEATVERAPLVQVAAAVAPRVSEIVGELLETLLRQVGELRGDEVVIGRLRASIESNVSQLLHLMEQSVDLHLVEPPAGALQFAQRLAQRGVPLSALWRAYHLCNARLFVICLHELARHGDTVMDLAEQTTVLSELLNTYVDHVCDRIGTTYDVERERWLRQQDAVRTERLSELLAGRVGGTAEVEAALGYPADRPAPRRGPLGHRGGRGRHGPRAPPTSGDQLRGAGRLSGAAARGAARPVDGVGVAVGAGSYGYQPRSRAGAAPGCRIDGQGRARRSWRRGAELRALAPACRCCAVRGARRRRYHPDRDPVHGGRRPELPLPGPRPCPGVGPGDARCAGR
jgi:hypothetical protein